MTSVMTILSFSVTNIETFTLIGFQNLCVGKNFSTTGQSVIVFPFSVFWSFSWEGGWCVLKDLQSSSVFLGNRSEGIFAQWRRTLHVSTDSVYVLARHTFRVWNVGSVHY